MAELPRPSKIVCIGRNYLKHAEELGNTVPEQPLIFLKPPSSLISNGDPIVRPPDVGRVDFEGEIALLIGTTCTKVSEGDAWEYVAQVAALNDVTAREMQRRDDQWSRAKGIDTFCPLGEGVAASDLDPDELSVVTTVNGVERQRGVARDMAFGPRFLVSYISRYMTLEVGDVIATGTPEGVGPLEPGDVVTVDVPGVSSVTNEVVAGPAVDPGA